MCIWLQKVGICPGVFSLLENPNAWLDGLLSFFIIDVLPEVDSNFLVSLYFHEITNQKPLFHCHCRLFSLSRQVYRSQNLWWDFQGILKRKTMTLIQSFVLSLGLKTIKLRVFVSFISENPQILFFFSLPVLGYWRFLGRVNLDPTGSSINVMVGDIYHLNVRYKWHQNRYGLTLHRLTFITGPSEVLEYY